MAAPADVPGGAAGALDRFFALSLDLLCIASLDGFFVRINPAFLSTLGHTESELLGRPWLEFVHPDDRAATAREGQRLAAGAPTVSFVNRYRCGDGSYRWLEWTSIPVPEEGLLYAVARDVTERLRAEEALRASEERHRAILDRAFSAFVAIDARGDVIAWNAQAEATFGWSREEALGRRLSELVIPPRHRRAHEEGLARVIGTSEGRILDRQLEVEALHRSGREIPVELCVTAVGSGEATTFNAFLQDISERKRIQSLRVQTAKLAALGEMVAGVAHEVNNPLSYVSNNVAVLERALASLRRLVQVYAEADAVLAESTPALHRRVLEASEEHDREFTLNNVDRIFSRTRDGLRRIQQIVKDLRSFAHVDQGERLEADLNEGIVSTVNIVRGRARALGVVDVELDLGPLPPIACFPAKINQVVMNLLSNAIDASPRGGRITVRTRGDDRSVTIEVIDEGPGVPAELVDRIFDPFFTTKPPGSGTGLGLSISYGIVEDHGGTIGVETPPGGGARFTVTLPRSGG
jgi:two-component system, NtrC family, sensor kinase